MPELLPYVVAAVVVLLFIALLFTRPSKLNQAVKVSLKDKDIAPVLQVMKDTPELQRATQYNTAIKQIWDAYERELACKLIKEMMKDCGKTPIAQHWLMTALQIEPDIARKTFSESFLKEHYDPEMIASCGVSCGGAGGCCGR